MATAGRPAKVLDMIALDAGEAAEFLAGALGAEDDKADGRILPARDLAPQTPAAHGSATEWENAQQADFRAICNRLHTLF